MNKDQIEFATVTPDVQPRADVASILQYSVMFTLFGAMFMVLGFPFMAFGGGLYYFGMILFLIGLGAFTYGVFEGGLVVIGGYFKDFKRHWRPHYKKAALIGALIGLFISLIYWPVFPIFMLIGAAIGVHVARKADGDTAFQTLPDPVVVETDTRPL